MLTFHKRPLITSPSKLSTLKAVIKRLEERIEIMRKDPKRIRKYRERQSFDIPTIMLELELDRRKINHDMLRIVAEKPHAKAIPVLKEIRDRATVIEKIHKDHRSAGIPTYQEVVLNRFTRKLAEQLLKKFRQSQKFPAKS